MIPLEALSECAARFLAAAVLDLFPKTLLIEGHATLDGFFYRFGFSEEVMEEVFPFIEERMRILAQEAHPLKESEMMTKNLGNFFRHHRQPIRAMVVEESEDPLCTVITIGAFKDMCPPPFPIDTMAFSAIKLTSLHAGGWNEEMERWEIQIEGVVAASKESLKERLKKQKEGKALDLMGAAERLKLCSADGKFLLEEGIRYRKRMEEWLQKKGVPLVATPLLNEEGEFRSSFLEAHIRYFEEKLTRKEPLPYRLTESGPLVRILPPYRQLPLYHQEEIYTDQTHFLIEEKKLEEILNSSLQFIKVSITLFSFEGTWRLVRRGKVSKKRSDLLQARYKTLKTALQGLSIEIEEQKESDPLEGSPNWQVQVVVKDLIGREWILSTLTLFDETKLSEQASTILVEYSLFTSWELLMALQLEKNPRNIPHLPADGAL